MRSFIRRFIGTKDFYRQTVTIVLPIIIQSTVSNVVNLLDNVMVGQVGTLEMSAVAIINQLMFVFNLCIFGGLAGPGIFSTQFVGAKDWEGVRNCFRMKLWLAIAMSAIAAAVFVCIPDKLIGLYLNENGDAAQRVMQCAAEYLDVMLFGLLPFGLTCTYAMTLRETGETRLPMFASITAIFVNLIFNWLLIFGNLGCPKLGVKGAAIATVFSRFVELAIVVIASHRRSDKFCFIKGVYRTLLVPVSLVKRVAVKGLPLLFNEFFWSSGMAAILACYAQRGIDAVAACNIASTVNNLFNVVFLSMGNAVAIMVGQALGSDDLDGAVDLAWKLMATSVMSSIVIGAVMFVLAPLIPQVYQTEESVRATAADLLRVLALFMPFFSIPHCCYFTLRSGGRTMITFVFDSVFAWCVNFTCAWALCSFTTLPIVAVYALVQATELLKGALGIWLVKKRIWVRNIVGGL